jgi:hypothetical protein
MLVDHISEGLLVSITNEEIARLGDGVRLSTALPDSIPKRLDFWVRAHTERSDPSFESAIAVFSGRYHLTISDAKFTAVRERLLVHQLPLVTLATAERFTVLGSLYVPVDAPYAGTLADNS